MPNDVVLDMGAGDGSPSNTEKMFFSVGGMTCSACSGTVETCLQDLDGEFVLFFCLSLPLSLSLPRYVYSNNHT